MNNYEFIPRNEDKIVLDTYSSTKSMYETNDFSTFFVKLEKFLKRNPIYGVSIQKYGQEKLIVSNKDQDEVLDTIKKRISDYTKNIEEAHYEDIFLYNKRNMCPWIIRYSNEYLNNYYHLYTLFQVNDRFGRFEEPRRTFYNDKLFCKMKNYTEKEKETFRNFLKEEKSKILSLSLLESKRKISELQFLKEDYRWLKSPTYYEWEY